MPSSDRPLSRAQMRRRATEKVLQQRRLEDQPGERIEEDRPEPTPRPRDGDVVVTYENRSPAYFAVRQVPGVVQLSAATREGALRVARAFAQKHGLDLWFSEDGTYRLLEAYRTRTRSVDSGVGDACG